MKIYISSLAEKGKSISEIVEKLALNGVNNIELTGGTKNSNFDLKELLELKAKYNLNYLCHNYFPPPKDDFIINLGSLNNEIFDKSIEHVKTAIMLSNTLESDKFACHSGFFIDFSLNEIGNKILNQKIINIKESIRLGQEGMTDIMLITECGTADRVMAETKQKLNIMGTCVMCRHMKATLLEDILQALREPRAEQIIELDQKIIEKAKFSLDEMFRYAEL